MSREEYQIPTGSPAMGSPKMDSSTGFGGGSYGVSASRDYGADGAGGVMHYTCGDCAVRVPLV